MKITFSVFSNKKENNLLNDNIFGKLANYYIKTSFLFLNSVCHVKLNAMSGLNMCE